MYPEILPTLRQKRKKLKRLTAVMAVRYKNIEFWSALTRSILYLQRQIFHSKKELAFKYHRFYKIFRKIEQIRIK